MEAHPDRKRELEPHGAPRVPATIHDGRVVHGWNPKALAELVGAKYESNERLAPDELARRLDRVLDATQRIVAQLPPAVLDTKAPDRDRSVRQIETYYGPQTAHDFMERTTWHAAQHLRQLYWFAGKAGVTPQSPLGDRDFAGLPLPNDVWS